MTLQSGINLILMNRNLFGSVFFRKKISGGNLHMFYDNGNKTPITRVVIHDKAQMKTLLTANSVYVPPLLFDMDFQ